MAINPERLAVGRMAQGLASGYYAFLVAHLVAVNPTSINSLPPAKALGQDPTGEIKRKDGTFHTLNLRFYLDLLREDQSRQRQFLRTWAVGALLTLGDELAKPEHGVLPKAKGGYFGYFDHAPILELVYHLRNGIAHGNRFNITPHGKERLAKHEAHNRHAAVKSPLGTVYEITSDSKGPILFDFIGPADVIDLLQSIEVYLSR
jgi:hypothetical protein